MVLWDFDGTLADSWSCGREIYNEIAARHGFAPITDIDAIRQMSTREFLKRHRISVFRLAKFVREWQGGMRTRMAEVGFYPGILDALQTLRNQGATLGILSSNAVENIRICLANQQVEDLFTVVESSPRLFGKAGGIRRILKRQSLTRRDLLYIGDETRDLDAAHKAGVDSAAVGWGLHRPETLRGHAPTHLVERAAQIPALRPRPIG
jgi:phosphoglycolate phosphatase